MRIPREEYGSGRKTYSEWVTFACEPRPRWQPCRTLNSRFATGCGKSSLFCHSERSEESLFDLTPRNEREIPRFARNDKKFGVLFPPSTVIQVLRTKSKASPFKRTKDRTPKVQIQSPGHPPGWNMRGKRALRKCHIHFPCRM